MSIPEIKNLPSKYESKSYQHEKDYQSPVRVSCMREVFKDVGQVWLDLGKSGTDLNFMISSPIFRHRDDDEFESLNELHKSSGYSLVQDELEDPMLQCMHFFQAKDATLLDLQKLLLLGILYCKGSRIGKSTMLYPIIVQDVKSTPVLQFRSPDDQRETVLAQKEQNKAEMDNIISPHRISAKKADQAETR